MTTIAEVAVRLRGDPAALLSDAAAAGSKAGDQAGTAFSGSFKSKALAGGLSALSGLVTANLVQMDSALAKYRADTGATEAEVTSASKAINEAYKSNRQSIAEIGDTLGTLRTDMGLTQDQADAMLDPFLRFATVTGQTGPQAVKGFDDILDAFNLTADHSQEIMDKLVLSHQRYGGSITENQAALSAMAPQLKALNLGVDDGIGLLNLFASKGIDASAAQKALNQAVQHLPAGTTLQAFITKLSAIEDPGKRAAAAVDVFGAKAGVAMANALGPGVDSLGQFAISAKDAAGATDKAADDINGALTNKIQLALRDFVGTIAGFAAPAGPVITGIGAVVSGVHAIGTALGVEAGAAVAKWAAILGPLAIGGLVIGGSVAAGAAILSAGSEAGGAAAKADPQAATLRLQQQVAAAIRNVRDAEDAGNLTHAESEKRVKALQDAYAELTGVIRHAMPVFAGDVEEANARIVAASQRTAIGIGTDTEEMAARWRAGAGDVTKSGTDMDDALLGQFKGVQEQARHAGERIPANLAEGITTTRQEPLDAFNTLVEMLKHPMTETAETARLLGELTGKKMAAGLKSADPDIRTAARAARDSIITRLEDIEPAAGTVSKKAMDAIVAGMKSKDPVIKAEAVGIYQTIRAQLALGDSKMWAQHAMDAYASGLASKENAVAAAASAAVRGARNVFAAASPPGPASPLHLIDVWGERTGLAWVDAFIASLETAEGKTKLTLAKVQKAFADVVATYPGVGSLIPSATPEAQIASLNRYIASDTAALGKTTDPAERLRLYQEIADYQQRIVALQGKTATEEQKAAQTLIGYVQVLDKALLTETDPKRIADMQKEIETYIARIKVLMTPPPPPPKPVDAPDPNEQKDVALQIQKLDLEHQKALLSQTPELAKQHAAELKIIDAQLAQIDNDLADLAYQREKNRLLLEQLNLVRAASGLGPLDSLPSTTDAPGGTDYTGHPNPGGKVVHPPMGGSTTATVAPVAVDADAQPVAYWDPETDTLPARTGPNTVTVTGQDLYGSNAPKAGGTGAGAQINVVVNNPKPEPASTSTARELQLLATTGILGG